MNRHLRAAGWKHMRHNERVNARLQAFAKRQGNVWVVRNWGNNGARGVSRSFRAAVFDWVLNDVQSGVTSFLREKAKLGTQAPRTAPTRAFQNCQVYIDGKAAESITITSLTIEPSPEVEQVRKDIELIRGDGKLGPIILGEDNDGSLRLLHHGHP